MTGSTPAGSRVQHAPSPVIRVVIADDHAIVRDGLRALVEAQRRFAAKVPGFLDSGP